MFLFQGGVGVITNQRPNKLPVRKNKNKTRGGGGRVRVSTNLVFIVVYFDQQENSGQPVFWLKYGF